MELKSEIKDKVKEKSAGNDRLETLVLNLLNKEAEGIANYKSFYTEEIKKAAKE